MGILDLLIAAAIPVLIFATAVFLAPFVTDIHRQ